jgi:hypothetical protein
MVYIITLYGFVWYKRGCDVLQRKENKNKNGLKFGREWFKLLKTKPFQLLE